MRLASLTAIFGSLFPSSEARMLSPLPTYLTWISSLPPLAETEPPSATTSTFAANFMSFASVPDIVSLLPWAEIFALWLGESAMLAVIFPFSFFAVR